MKRLPRLLPLVAVAVTGVLAVNVLAGAGILPNALEGARAWAEDLAEGTTPASKAAPVKAPVGPMPDTKLTDGPAAPAVCAPTPAELAREAGLSTNELAAIQRLGERRAELDGLDGDLDTQIQLLMAAETKVDARIRVLGEMIATLRTLLGQADSAEEAENARLVKIYETMAPRQAAVALSTMADDVRLPLLAEMKESKLAAIFNEMSKRDPAVTREITEKLAQRTRAQYALDTERAAAAAAAADGTAPATTAAAPPAKTPAPKAGAQPKATTPAPKAAAAPPKAAPAQPKVANSPAPKAETPATPPATPPAKSG